MYLIANMQTLEQKCNHNFIQTPDNHEIVCSKCGLVREKGTIHSLPFGQTFSPTSAISFGKSLGDTLNYYGLLRVLAKSANGRQDLGLRAKEIRLITQTVEPPAMKKCLEIASVKLIILGFDANHVIANDVGSLLRKLTIFCMLSKINCSSKELADAALYYTLKKHGYEPDPPPQRNNGTIETNTLKFREKFLRLCRLLDAQTRDF
jgi:hypothetical protein